jgi:hypothetical protein
VRRDHVVQLRRSIPICFSSAPASEVESHSTRNCCGPHWKFSRLPVRCRAAPSPTQARITARNILYQKLGVAVLGARR